MKNILLLILISFCISCGDEHIPKPKAFLRLDYPKAQYKNIDVELLPFTFEKNELSQSIQNIKIDTKNNTYGIEVKYPSLKGTIYLTYKEVINNNVLSYIKDAQKLTQKHTIKADEITERVFEDSTHNVYGTFYEVGGNAASQSQFYATDSTKHFLTGSLYFYIKPNYDSIYPAAVYLKKDVKKIIESLRWK